MYLNSDEFFTFRRLSSLSDCGGGGSAAPSMSIFKGLRVFERLGSWNSIKKPKEITHYLGRI